MNLDRMNLSVLRNDAHFQFHTEIGRAIVQYDAEEMKIDAQYQEYSALYSDVDSALKKIIKSDKTELIQEADKARDETWSGFIDSINAALKHPAPAFKEAARRLKIVTDTYGNVARKTLNEETSAIYNIMQDLEGPRYAPDVAATGLGLWVAELKARNIAFSSLMNERYDETADRCSIVLREARKKLDKCYKHILKCIEVFASSYGEGKYEAFSRKHNSIVAKYEATTGRSKPAKPGAQEET